MCTKQSALAGSSRPDQGVGGEVRTEVTRDCLYGSFTSERGEHGLNASNLRRNINVIVRVLAGVFRELCFCEQEGLLSATRRVV